MNAIERKREKSILHINLTVISHSYGGEFYKWQQDFSS